MGYPKGTEGVPAPIRMVPPYLAAPGWLPRTLIPWRLAEHCPPTAIDIIELFAALPTVPIDLPIMEGRPSPEVRPFRQDVPVGEKTLIAFPCHVEA